MFAGWKDKLNAASEVAAQKIKEAQEQAKVMVTYQKPEEEESGSEYESEEDSNENKTKPQEDCVEYKELGDAPVDNSHSGFAYSPEETKQEEQVSPVK